MRWLTSKKFKSSRIHNAIERKIVMEIINLYKPVVPTKNSSNLGLVSTFISNFLRDYRLHYCS